MRTLLEAREVGVRLERRPVLEAVSFALRAGECVGLIGPNGAGKTTLLRVLARLLAPATGRVLFAGQSLEQVPARQLARDLGYLAQGAPAHWPLTVETLVTLGRTPYLHWWRGAGGEDQAAVERALQMADVQHLRERRVDTLSGGERLRVLLARVFATAPRLILADEPIAALDPYHQLHIMELLREHAHRGGAVVAVLHDLNLAARFCDRLVLMDAGHIAASGSVAEVLSDRHLRQVYGIEAHVFDHAGEHFVLPLRRAR